MKKKIHLPLLPLSIFLVLFSACNVSINQSIQNRDHEDQTNVTWTQEKDQRVITTVARIIKLENGNIKFNFNERQAVFILDKSNPSFDKILRLATEAQARTRPVKLIYTGHNSFVDLVEPTQAETAKYLEWYKLKLVKPEPDRPIRLGDLDSVYFNFPEWQNWKAFKLCTNTVPSFAEAKKIFNYCAAQGCYLGPTQVQPCIPFEFVIDGCFARAHKMRQIIETKFYYCSEKVFSYGDLNVKADKWGGCCVGWWYHVAPLIRVKNAKGGRSSCYVIDPGMFNEPVLLSVWLNAQKNISCDAAAGVTSYSIQPSSAYTPSYSTDPNYSQTNADLIYYNGMGNTCDN